tara:strand:- start:166 stop:990 length:825 start_codon:yes stop_codon:yes gene_type:complete
MGTGSGFLSDINANFNTGSKEYDADASSSRLNLYEKSTYPWYMNAQPSQSMVSSSLFNTFTLTDNFTSSVVLNRFLSESVDFGPIYTVNTASAAVEVEIDTTINIKPDTSAIPTLFAICPLYNAIGGGNEAGFTNSGGDLDLTINISSGATTNYSSSLVFIQPPQTDSLTSVPWATITSGGTGTVGPGSSTLTVTTPAGFSGVNESNIYSRAVRVRLFQQIGGVFEPVDDVNGCTIIQQYRVQSQGSGLPGGGLGNINTGNDLGGIINPILQIP